MGAPSDCIHGETSNRTIGCDTAHPTAVACPSTRPSCSPRREPRLPICISSKYYRSTSGSGTGGAPENDALGSGDRLVSGSRPPASKPSPLRERVSTTSWLKDCDTWHQHHALWTIVVPPIDKSLVSEELFDRWTVVEDCVQLPIRLPTGRLNHESTTLATTAAGQAAPPPHGFPPPAPTGQLPPQPDGLAFP